MWVMARVVCEERGVGVVRGKWVVSRGGKWRGCTGIGEDKRRVDKLVRMTSG